MFCIYLRNTQLPVLGESDISIGVALHSKSALEKLAQLSSSFPAAQVGALSQGFPASAATGIAKSPADAHAVNDTIFIIQNYNLKKKIKKRGKKKNKGTKKKKSGEIYSRSKLSMSIESFATSAIVSSSSEIGSCRTVEAFSLLQKYLMMQFVYIFIYLINIPGTSCALQPCLVVFGINTFNRFLTRLHSFVTNLLEEL